MSLDDFAPSGEPADDLDEDLFDFPPIQSSESSPIVPAPSETKSGAAKARELHAELEEQDSLLPAEEPLDDLASLDMSLDDEDEDLFGFPNPQAQTPQENYGSDADESLADDADAPEEPLLEEDIDHLIREAKSASARNREENYVGAKENEATYGELEPVARSEADVIVAQPPAQAAPTLLGLGASSRALWVFTGASILFMIGVLMIAWNLSSAFEKQLQVARAQSPDSQSPEARQAIQQDPAQHYPPDTNQDVERIDDPSALSSTDGSAVRLPRQPRESSKTLADLEAPHESVLVVAESAIADGRFIEARRLLFGLLAEIDRIPADSRARAEERATFLIAGSHKAEAELLLENPE